jgi:transposase-like protein
MNVPDVKCCPACGSLSAVLAVDRFGVQTFYCTNCEYDWDEHADDGDQRPPDAPSPQ